MDWVDALFVFDSYVRAKMNENKKQMTQKSVEVRLDEGEI